MSDLESWEKQSEQVEDINKGLENKVEDAERVANAEREMNEMLNSEITYSTLDSALEVFSGVETARNEATEGMNQDREEKNKIDDEGNDKTNEFSEMINKDTSDISAMDSMLEKHAGIKLETGGITEMIVEKGNSIEQAGDLQGQNEGNRKTNEDNFKRKEQDLEKEKTVEIKDEASTHGIDSGDADARKGQGARA